jgi:hypothetical protein
MCHKVSAEARIDPRSQERPRPGKLFTMDLLALGFVVAALAQAPRQVAAPAERLAFTIEFQDGRINRQPVGATVGSAWTPMFPRVVPWLPRAGEPALDAIKYAFERTPEGVRFKVGVLLGRPHQREIVVQEGTLRVGERARVEGVLAYGARPVVVGLIPLETSAYHEPTPGSAAPSLVITGVEIVTEPAPRYLVTVENLKDRGVESLWVETRRSGRPAHSGSEGHEEGGALVPPRGRHTFDFPFPTGPPATTDGWAPAPADEVTITAVVWDDGTFEGSARQAAVHALRLLARRTQLERLVPLLDRARADANLQHAVATLGPQIEALSIEVDPALMRSAQPLVPPSGELPLHEVTTLLRTFLQRVKTLAARDLEQIERALAAGNADVARGGLQELHQRFATWLARLRPQRGADRGGSGSRRERSAPGRNGAGIPAWFRSRRGFAPGAVPLPAPFRSRRGPFPARFPSRRASTPLPTLSVREILAAPIERKLRHLLERARFLEQVRGPRDDLQVHRRADLAHGRLVDHDDRLVVAADDEQRGRLHARQRIARQVRAAAA